MGKKQSSIENSIKTLENRALSVPVNLKDITDILNRIADGKNQQSIKDNQECVSRIMTIVKTRNIPLIVTHVMKSQLGKAGVEIETTHTETTEAAQTPVLEEASEEKTESITPNPNKIANAKAPFKAIQNQINTAVKPNNEDIRTAIVQTLQNLSDMKKEADLENHEHQFSVVSRQKLYDEVMKFAIDNNIIISLTDNMKTSLRDVGVVIPPTWADTAKYYTGLLTTRASDIVSSAKTMVNQVTMEAASTTDKGFGLLVTAATAVNKSAGDLLNTVKESASEMLNQEKRFEGTEDTVAGLYAQAQVVSDATQSVINEASTLATTVKTTVTEKAVEATVSAGINMLMKIDDFNTAVATSHAAVIANQVYETASSIPGNVATMVTNAKSLVGTTVNSASTSLLDSANLAQAKANELVGHASTLLTETANSTLDTALQRIQDAAEGLGGATKDIVNLATALPSAATSKIVGAIKGIGETILQQVADIEVVSRAIDDNLPSEAAQEAAAAAQAAAERAAAERAAAAQAAAAQAAAAQAEAALQQVANVYQNDKQSLSTALNNIISSMEKKTKFNTHEFKERLWSGEGSEKLAALKKIEVYLHGTAPDVEKAKLITQQICAYKRNPLGIFEPHSLRQLKEELPELKNKDVTPLKTDEIKKIIAVGLVEYIAACDLTSVTNASRI